MLDEIVTCDPKTSNPSGQTSPAVSRDPGLSDEARSWAWLMVANLLRGNVAAPLREMSDQLLRHMAASISVDAIVLAQLLDQWRLPQSEGCGFWVGQVLPAIRAELERRARPKRTYGPSSPIARLKQLNLAEVAGRFTELSGSGNRLKGRCPLHQERTPSFYVYQDRQRWSCFGACHDGGDVVDLLRRLGDQGKLT